MNIITRPFLPGDIDFALTQTQREGWHSTDSSLRNCLAHDPDGGFVTEVDGSRAGMVTTTQYSKTGWVGNLIVEPKHRSRGIGRALMRRAMTHLQARGVRTIRLEANPPGVCLYQSLGFMGEFVSPRFFLEPSERQVVTELKPISAADGPALRAFDQTHFGDDRGRWLDLLIDQALAGYISRARDRVLGYVLASPSSIGGRIGPFVAVDPEVAERLLEAVVTALSRVKLNIALPETNRNGVELLRARGFQPAPSCLRMIWGERAGIGQPEHVYALASGATG